MSLSRDGLRLLHYWWPLALGWSTTLVVQRATGRAPDAAGLLVLLFGIGAAYSLDRVIDPGRIGRGALLGVLVFAGAACAAACARVAVQLPIETAVLVPLLGAIALGYGYLKKLPLVKTVALPLIWTWSTIALPYGDGSWFGWHALRLPIALPLLLLIGAGCLLCDLKDEQSDRQEGIASLPAQIGAERSARLALVLALIAAFIAMLEHRTGLAVSAIALSLTALWPRFLATETVGPLLVDVVLTLPGILIVTRLV